MADGDMTMSIGGGPDIPLTTEAPQAAVQQFFAGKTPMRETDADRAVKDRVFESVGEEIRRFIERYEHLEAEKKDIASQMKEVMAGAKGRGYDTKILRKIVDLRKRNADDIAEEEAVLEMYKAALGMA